MRQPRIYVYLPDHYDDRTMVRVTQNLIDAFGWDGWTDYRDHVINMQRTDHPQPLVTVHNEALTMVQSYTVLEEAHRLIDEKLERIA